MTLPACGGPSPVSDRALDSRPTGSQTTAGTPHGHADLRQCGWQRGAATMWRQAKVAARQWIKTLPGFDRRASPLDHPRSGEHGADHV
jgi:hypothetical protein